MKLVVTVEHRFDQTPDGAVWTQTQYAHSWWAPYVEVFEEVRVVGRARPCAAPPAGWRRVDGPGVTFAALPYYIGPWQYLWQRRRVRQAVRAAVGPEDAVLLRVPSQIGYLVEPMLTGQGRPFAIEVLGDPYDVFAPGANRHPLARFFRWWFPRKLRHMCQRASQAAYVTREALQRRYPCPAGMVGYSDVEINDDALLSQPRPARLDQGRRRLLFVGTLAQLYKAPDVLIDAVAVLAKEGLDLELTMVGDGHHRQELADRAAGHGLGERIRFLGQLTAGTAVRAELDRADLFVLPSHQEGLPRAMVEAMARGLPCLGSTVGGLPELLAEEDMVPPGDVSALAGKIRQVLSQPERLAAMSARNLARARDYHTDLIAARRLGFYQELKEKTMDWLDGQDVKARCLATPQAAGGK